METLELLGKTVGTRVGERRKTRRHYLRTRAYIPVDGPDVDWGSVTNMSWTGVALCLCTRRLLNPGQKVSIGFRFVDGERRVTESLASTVIWQNGDHIGLAFAPPLTTGSPALQQAPLLVSHLMMQEA